MYIQNLHEPVFLIISVSTTFKLLHFELTMLRHNGHSIKFLQLTDLLHVLPPVVWTDFRPDRLIRKIEKM